MLTVLAVRLVLLRGSLAGVEYYVTPQFEKLTNYEAWTDAATQVMFSLSVANGGLITLSSFNNFRNNCRRSCFYLTGGASQQGRMIIRRNLLSF